MTELDKTKELNGTKWKAILATGESMMETVQMDIKIQMDQIEEAMMKQTISALKEIKLETPEKRKEMRLVMRVAMLAAIEKIVAEMRRKE